MKYRNQILFALGLLLGTCVRAQAIFVHDRQLPGAELTVVEAELAPFYHGVASGDPLADRVVIWTRITADTLTGTSIDVAWTVATDPELSEVVRQGTFTTDASRDYTVKVDVDGLRAGTTYYYGFTALGSPSLTGRTKTTPTGDASDHLRFGVVSCSNFQAGYFNAYARLAERNDLDAVVHLGDYIYEYGELVYGNEEVWNDRTIEPATEIVDLDDYRTRYSTYRLDADLRRMHQQHPILSVWDDHESANDSYVDGAANHQPDDEGSWEVRKGRSRQAYFEWMPIRDVENRSIYRSVSYGNLADLILLDTRLEGRDRQINDVTDPALGAEDRTLLGSEQKAWFFDQLTTSTARYKLIANQVVFSEFNIGWFARLAGQTYETAQNPFLDIWDGYPAERRQVVNLLKTGGIEDVVFLTGDFHNSLVYEVAVPAVDVVFREVEDIGRVAEYEPTDYDPATGDGAVAVEFVTPSVTAANFADRIGEGLAQLIQEQLNTDVQVNDTLNLGNPNPHLKYNDLATHGYYLLDVRPAGVQADYYETPILELSAEETFAAGFTKEPGSNHLEPAAAPAPGKAVQDTPAPADPPGTTSVASAPGRLTVLSLSPNPASDDLRLQYALARGGRVGASLVDAAGRLVRELLDIDQPAGLYTLEVSVKELAAGSYYLRLTTADGVSLQPLIKR